MVWKRLTKSPNRKPQAQVRFRPNLTSLEDRLLLSLTNFYVDDTQSVLTLSGNFAGAPLQAQGAGSLTAAYTGAFQADIDYSPGFPNAITFYNGGNDVAGENSGNWQPLSDGSSGAEPAVYGGQVSFLGTAYAAVRNVNVGATSDPNNPLPMTSLGDGVSYTFPNSQTLTINSGNAAYTHPLLGHGTFDISGNSAANQADNDGNASYLYDFNGDGSSLELYVAVDITISGTVSGFQYQLNIDGAIVAYGTLGTGSAGHGVHAQGSAATLGTALTSGTHSTGQALISPLGNLEHSNSSRTQQANLANAQSQGNVATTDLQMAHQAGVAQLDAAFIDMSPIENMMI